MQPDNVHGVARNCRAQGEGAAEAEKASQCLQDNNVQEAEAAWRERGGKGYFVGEKIVENAKLA